MAEDPLQDDSFNSDGAVALDSAIQRLDRALSALEAKLAARAAHDDREGDLFENDRDRLAAELDAARARERALQDVAAEASAALGRAAAEVRAALSAEEG
jgi:Skp family chaperone for outer membrane proteins